MYLLLYTKSILKACRSNLDHTSHRFSSGQETKTSCAKYTRRPSFKLTDIFLDGYLYGSDIKKTTKMNKKEPRWCTITPYLMHHTYLHTLNTALFLHCGVEEGEGC